MDKKKNIPHALSDDTLDNVVGGYTLQNDCWTHRPQIKPCSDSPVYDPMLAPFKPREDYKNESIES